MLKTILFIVSIFLSLHLQGQADLDDLICFPDYGKEVKDLGVKTIKKYLIIPKHVKLKELIILDDHFRPKRIVYGENISKKKITDIINVDYSRFDEGIVIRVDSIFRTSPNVHLNIYDGNGNYVKSRKTDKKGRIVVKKMYKIDSIDTKVTTIYMYDKDTISEQDALIPLFFPRVIIDEYGIPKIVYESKMKAFNYENIENKIITRGSRSEILQEIKFENGRIKSLCNNGAYYTVSNYEYDSLNRVTTLITRNIIDSLQEQQEYFYNETNGRVSNITVTTKNSKNEMRYQYFTGRPDSVGKIEENFWIDDTGQKVLVYSNYFSNHGLLLKHSYSVFTNKGVRYLLTEKYRWEK